MITPRKAFANSVRQAIIRQAGADEIRAAILERSSVVLADERIAELEAEVTRLKRVLAKSAMSTEDTSAKPHVDIPIVDTVDKDKRAPGYWAERKRAQRARARGA